MKHEAGKPRKVHSAPLECRPPARHATGTPQPTPAAAWSLETARGRCRATQQQPAIHRQVSPAGSLLGAGASALGQAGRGRGALSRATPTGWHPAALLLQLPSPAAAQWRASWTDNTLTPSATRRPPRAAAGFPASPPPPGGQEPGRYPQPFGGGQQGYPPAGGAQGYPPAPHGYPPPQGFEQYHHQQQQYPQQHYAPAPAGYPPPAGAQHGYYAAAPPHKPPPMVVQQQQVPAHSGMNGCLALW